MSTDSVLRAFYPRPGDKTRYRIKKYDASAPPRKIDPRPTKPGKTLHLPYPIWDEQRQEVLYFRHQWINDVRGRIKENQRLSGDASSRPSAVRFTSSSGETTIQQPVIGNVDAAPTRFTVTTTRDTATAKKGNSNKKEYNAYHHNNNDDDNDESVACRPSSPPRGPSILKNLGNHQPTAVRQRSASAAMTDDTTFRPYESSTFDAKPSVTTNQPARRLTAYAPPTAIDVDDDDEPTAMNFPSVVEHVMKNNDEKENENARFEKPRSRAASVVKSQPRCEESEPEIDDMEGPSCYDAQSTNIFSTYSMCSVAPQRAASRAISVALSPIKVNLPSTRETASRRGTTMCQQYGFRPIFTPEGSAIEIASVAHDVKDNYSRQKHKPVDLWSGVIPTLHHGKVQLHDETYTITSSHLVEGTERYVYMGTADNHDNVFCAIYEWRDGAAEESVRMFVASHTLNVNCAVTGFRSEDKSLGYTVVLFPQTMYPLREFLSNNAPNAVKEATLWACTRSLRSLCTRRLVHTALSQDTVLVGVKSADDGYELVVMPIMWDDCIDFAMFSYRSVQFISTAAQRRRHNVGTITGSQVDFLALCQLVQCVDNPSAAGAALSLMKKAMSGEKITSLTFGQVQPLLDGNLEVAIQFARQMLSCCN
eukprot:PhM_4_TR16097/c0_g1_i1/m.90055